MSPVLSVVGKSGVGKTTLIEKLLPLLRARGLRVAVIKHHAHATPIDTPGKDTWRFAEAGASAVFVSSPIEIARFERVPQELSLKEIAARIADVELILTDGFAREPSPKLEVCRLALGTDRVERGDEVVAIASDYPIAAGVPRFHLDDAAGIASFVCEHLSLPAVP